MSIIKEIKVLEEDKDKRLDLYLSMQKIGISRSRIQNLIENSKIRINSRLENKCRYKVKPEDIILVEIPEAEKINIQPEKIPLKILYEDDHLIVINKPKGMVTHPAKGNYSGTLVSALLYHCKNLSGINGYLRPGIVHRLDKDTTGVMVAAKDDITHAGLVKQWQDRTITRKYIALVNGEMDKSELTVDEPIGRHKVQRQRMAVNLSSGRNAISKIKILEKFNGVSLIEVRILTGRTHQIRVHLSYLKHPVIGDALYGKKSDIIDRQALHAAVLGFTHPITNKYMEFSSPIPKDMKQAVKLIKKPS
ncbi:MAG: RluA family pseudouridine synthase [bacterium]|nr:RluA family pseudouridine synthase [bacterium]